MDTNNWPNQGGTGGGDSTIESVDWRSQWPADQRQKTVNQIILYLKKNQSCGSEKPHEIENIALRIEEKFYTTATSQTEYMRKISVKLMTLESRSAKSNSLQSNSDARSVNPSDQGSQGMKQVNNQGQPLPIHAPSNHPQSGKQILSQTIHNNISSSGVQVSAGVSSALPAGNGHLSQSTIPNIITQNPSLQNIQNMSRVQQNSIGISNFVNQRQIPGRQPQQPQQQQQSQNSQQYFYRHQLHQIAKHNLQQNYNATSVQSHIQQHQNLLQPGHFQPSLSTVQQNQHHQQSALRQQRQQQPQQSQSNPMGNQKSATNLQHSQQPHQHSVGQHTNFSAMYQQHLGPQSSAQLLGTQSGNSTNQHSTHMMQSKVSIPHQQVMTQSQTHSGPLQHQLNMKQQPNMSQRDMQQQRIPTSGGFQQQNVTDQQKQLFQQQRAMPEASSTSSDSTAQTGNPNSGDWQEEVYQKIKAMKDKYMAELNIVYQKIIHNLQQHESLPQQPKSDQFEKMKRFKQANEQLMEFLQLPKTNISPNYKEKLGLYEKHIVNLITTFTRKPGPTSHLHLQQQQQQQPNSTMFQHQLKQQQQLQHHRQQFLQKQPLHKKQQLPVIQLKSGPPFSPQIPSPNIDQQLTSVTKSANSPFTMSSPSTPSTSHVVGDSEKVVNSGVSSLPNAVNVGHQSNVAMLSTQSLPIVTPGISTSPLLAEFTTTTPDGNHGNDALVVSGKSSTVEQPIEHLLKVVKSISAKSLSASVSDIGSVVSMIDSIAGSSSSRAAIGEDLVATTKCRLQTTTTTTGTRKLKRFASAMPFNVVSSASSVNDGFMHFNGLDASELESTATSTIKRPRIETRNALLEEIRGINRGLIDTMVDIEADAEVGKGTLVKCSFGAVALCPNIKSQYASAKLSPIQPLRLLVPANYPNCSPILLDKFPVEVSKEHEDLSIKAEWSFRSYMRTLSEPMSLEEMARSWDVCARAVISEYAQQSQSGGTFTSKYGAWEDCLSQ